VYDTMTVPTPLAFDSGTLTPGGTCLSCRNLDYDFNFITPFYIPDKSVLKITFPTNYLLRSINPAINVWTNGI